MSRTRASLALLDGDRDWNWVAAASDSLADTSTLLTAWHTDLLPELRCPELVALLLGRAQLGPAHLKVLLRATDSGDDFDWDAETVFDTLPGKLMMMVQTLWRLPYLTEQLAALLLAHPHLLKGSAAGPNLEAAMKRGFYTSVAFILAKSRGDQWYNVDELVCTATELRPPAPSSEHLRVCASLAPTWSGPALELKVTAAAILNQGPV